MPTAGPEGQNTGELCVNARTSVSMTTDLCCRNEVKCLGQLKPNTAQPSVSQKIGRGVSAISSEAGHPGSVTSHPGSVAVPSPTH